MAREDRQTTLCVPLEVRQQSRSRLCAILDEVHKHPETYDRVPEEIPVLHFLSLSVFDHSAYDPQFVLEANFDGSPGVFWAQMEAAFGPHMREILRCCKPPLDEDLELYEAVTEEDSRAPVAPYFEARTEWPSVFHHGNRGLTRDRILAEARLFETVRDELDENWVKYRSLEPADVQAMLRSKLRPDHPWLTDPIPPRIPLSERAVDFVKLLIFVLVLVLVLSAPGIVLGLLLPWKAAVGIILLMAVLVGLRLWPSIGALPGTAIPTGFKLWRVLLGQWPLILIYIAGATVMVVPLFMLASWLLAYFGVGGLLTVGDAASLVWPAVAIGLLSLFVVTLPLLVFWLRFLERRDSSQDEPAVDDLKLREMRRREDWIAQNHMGSIVLVRPGVLRMLGIRIGHLALGLVLRVKAVEGYLGSMRTVHFAHWAFLNNRSRLMFMSNFDHSWASYLDDFIEKAHSGLTLAWGAGVGFPPTRFLLYDGASHGRQFKAWALASRAVSRVWFSAYRTLTVDQIERNYRIALGLRKPQLTDREAVAWMEDL